MPKALITGASGFVGHYLAQHLRELGYEVWGTSLTPGPSQDYEAAHLDVTHADQVRQVIAAIAPDEIYHLAAITRPTLGVVSEFYDVNLLGTLNVLEAAQETGASVLVVSSAYVYGRHDGVISEEARLEPVNHYGASKAAADLAALSYALSGLRVVRVRPFNHSGPGQSPDFLLPTLVRQLARIEAGLEEPVIRLGNLNSVRDFSDVRDVVCAYPLLLKEGENGGTYNVASGRGVSVRELADRVVALSSAPVRLEVEAARVRATDLPKLVGDAGKAKALGWRPTYVLERTLKEMFDAEVEAQEDT